MKIISKHKDFYDYLQGIYGVDEKLVLDRTKFHPIPYPASNYVRETFYICDYRIDGVWIDGKILFGKELEPYSLPENKSRFKKYFYSYRHRDQVLGEDKFYSILDSNTYNPTYRQVLKEPYKLSGEKSPNIKEECPILKSGGVDIYDKFPVLKEYNLQSVFLPEELWIMLSEWLGMQITRREKQVPIGDDNVRILSHGFDLKTSFRH